MVGFSDRFRPIPTFSDRFGVCRSETVKLKKLAAKVPEDTEIYNVTAFKLFLRRYLPRRDRWFEGDCFVVLVGIFLIWGCAVFRPLGIGGNWPVLFGGFVLFCAAMTVGSDEFLG